MPDAQTAVNAVQSGDIDFIESVPFDLVTVLAANKDLKVETLDKLGFQTIGQMNFLYPPFDNVKVRRAAFLAPKEGGWNMLFTNFIIADVVNPAVNILINAKGKNGAWFGERRQDGSDA